jgi:hypothetical protein
VQRAGQLQGALEGLNYGELQGILIDFLLGKKEKLTWEKKFLGGREGRVVKKKFQ